MLFRNMQKFKLSRIETPSRLDAFALQGFWEIQFSKRKICIVSLHKSFRDSKLRRKKSSLIILKVSAIWIYKFDQYDEYICTKFAANVQSLPAQIFTTAKQHKSVLCIWSLWDGMYIVREINHYDGVWNTVLQNPKNTYLCVFARSKGHYKSELLLIVSRWQQYSK